MSKLLSTKEVADFLGVNEKMIYTLISDKGLPATKITGKWAFPTHLVEQWVEANTVNYPKPSTVLPPYHGLLIIAGSNDPLLDRTITLFNAHYSDHVAVFGNMGSMGGLRALRQNSCHVATSHLLQEDEEEYNFDYAESELERVPAVVNFCKREQGIIVQKKNPKKIKTIKDLGKPGIRVANRPLSTGTRLLFDRELKKAGLVGEKIDPTGATVGTGSETAPSTNPVFKSNVAVQEMRVGNAAIGIGDRRFRLAINNAVQVNHELGSQYPTSLSLSSFMATMELEVYMENGTLWDAWDAETAQEWDIVLKDSSDNYYAFSMLRTKPITKPKLVAGSKDGVQVITCTLEGTKKQSTPAYVCQICKIAA